MKPENQCGAAPLLGVVLEPHPVVTQRGGVAAVPEVVRRHLQPRRQVQRHVADLTGAHLRKASVITRVSHAARGSASSSARSSCSAALLAGHMLIHVVPSAATAVVMLMRP